jgi:response regulator of citrate/malate metabolism
VSIRTLIVEDDALVADVHRSYVQRIPGFEVVGVVHRGAEALEAVGRTGVDLVLLDFHLPDVRGLDVCRALRTAGGGPVDVIAVTAARDLETVRSAVAHGVVQYLIKPFAFATFEDKLKRYAAYRRDLGGAGETDQAAVDSALAALRSTPPRLPKGLSQVTMDLVSSVLREASEELSAAEVAGHAGLSRVTARRYLEHLAAEGRVELGMRYGTSGRPEHRYRWKSL